MSNDKPKKPGTWRAGQSGNPKGKPPGTGALQRLRAGLDQHLPDILSALVDAAKAGDVMAARVILDRVLPSLKPNEQPVLLDLAGETLTAKAGAVLSAVSAGNLAPGQGSQLIAAIGQLARVAEIDELTARITALEARKNAKS
jgi:hypothetical protein